MENLEKKNKEAEPQIKKVFIELGSGNAPVSWAGKKEFDENEIYVGIDRASADLLEAKERMEEVGAENKNIHFVQTNIKTLPLKNHSADEVFLGNVLGDPSIKDAEKDKFIEEAKRVLKENGRIVIKETYTPPDYKYLKDFIKKHGLSVEKGADINNPEWKELVEPYDKTSAKSKWSGSYIVYLKPIDRKYTINDFRKEIAEIARNAENEADFPDEVNLDELTEEDAVYWAKLKNKTIATQDVAEYKKIFEKENGFENKTRYNFLMFASNKANVIIGNRELSGDK